MTALVFWLVLYGAGNGTSQTMIPVPYQTIESCKVGGDSYHVQLQGMYGAYYACVEQPRLDVEIWTEAHADRDGGY